MSVFTSMNDPMDQDKKDLMIENQELLSDMLDIAIQELEKIVEEMDICLLDNMNECRNYVSIFNCLKHQALKRK